MADVLTAEQRRLNMTQIKGKNTKPELMLRQGLHAVGLRFRVHVANLPGKPDLVFSRYHTAVFVHGCFWHGHDCPLFRLPSTRTEFWAKKIADNQARDHRVIQTLNESGWRILVVWECCLRGRGRRLLSEVINDCVTFIKTEDSKNGVLSGNWIQ